MYDKILVLFYLEARCEKLERHYAVLTISYVLSSGTTHKGLILLKQSVSELISLE